MDEWWLDPDYVSFPAYDQRREDYEFDRGMDEARLRGLSENCEDRRI